MLSPIQQIKQHLQPIMPETKLDLIPKKWEKIGDVLVIKLDNRLLAYQTEIGKTYATFLDCKSVLVDTGGIKGVYRKPELHFIYGDKDTRTIHQENGIKYKLDPLQIMFSSGNIDERIRMSTIDCSGEVIIDLFAGIGYFTLPLAVYGKPSKIYACEINPISFMFLQDNIVINNVDEMVTPLFGDSKKTAPHNVADRIIMGYFHETKSFLQTAIACLKKNCGILHYHDTFPDKNIPDAALKDIYTAAGHFNRKITLLDYRKVKSYAPGISHYVFDVKIER